MTIKEKADALIANQLSRLILIKSKRYNMIDVIKHTILSVEHTIEVLNNSNIKDDGQERLINGLIAEQTELLTELKSRL